MLAALLMFSASCVAVMEALAWIPTLSLATVGEAMVQAVAMVALTAIALSPSPYQ